MKSNNSFSGSIFLIALLAIMLLAALAAVIASSISAKSKIKINYLQKAKIKYLAESANAIGKNKLLNDQDRGELKNIKEKIFEDGIINIQINHLDNHLWEIESTAEDINRTIKYKISNIIIPDFEYSLFASTLIIDSKINPTIDAGYICATEIKNNNSQISIFCPKNLKFPEINISYYTSLIPFPGKDIVLLKGDNTILDGNSFNIEPKLYIATKNLILKNINSQASFVSLSGNIIISENCSISNYDKYPAIASLRNNIEFNDSYNEIIIKGLVYAYKNISINSSLRLKGAIYAKNSIILTSKNNQQSSNVNLIFDESILHTKGLILNWDSFKNVSWKISE